MKAIILLAGYATRLYPLTLNTPKALLKIGGKAILDYIFDEIEKIDAIDEVILITNQKFFLSFSEWAENREPKKPVKVVSDGTTSDETKLGAIGDIDLIINQEKINDDIMVLAGDMFFTFPLSEFYEFYQSVDRDCICAHELEDKNTLKRMAVALLDKDGRVTRLEEKPDEPKSNIGVEAFYIYKKETLPLFDEYIKAGNKPDAPGYFPSWLYKRKDIRAFLFSGECYDIGTPEAYKDVQKRFKAAVNVSK